MLSIQPKPVKFLLKGDGTDKFALKKGQILLSRSGTIGNVSYVNSTLENYFVSGACNKNYLWEILWLHLHILEISRWKNSCKIEYVWCCD